MSRGLALVDHKPRDGVTGFLTITGGKATTFRLMAETVVDAMCAQMGETRPCRTAHEPFPGSEDGKLYWLGSRLDDHEAQRGADQIICECELMPRRKLEELLARRPSATFDDVRRQLRLGMGPCQGGFCSYRTTGIAHELGCVDADRANLQLRSFLEHRWIGLHPILYGDQVRQTALDDWIFQGLLDVEHLPDGAPA